MNQRPAHDNSQAKTEGVQPAEVNSPVDTMGIADSLERILDASSETTARDQKDQEVYERLVATSQQLGDCEFSTSPVLTRMVDAAIGGMPILPSKDYQQMCEVVAGTLFEDTDARARLQRLWHQLQEGS